MVTFELNKLSGKKLAIFTIPLPNRHPVFMSINLTKRDKEKTGVVIVDPKNFIELWRNEPFSIHLEEAYGRKKTWENDRKYPQADKGFSLGRGNPVPLARVAHGIETRVIFSYKSLFLGREHPEKTFHHVGFHDGITRTIWLLAHECAAFPIECDMPGARDLYEDAAAPNTDFYTTGELNRLTSVLSETYNNVNRCDI